MAPSSLRLLKDRIRFLRDVKKGNASAKPPTCSAVHPQFVKLSICRFAQKSSKHCVWILGVAQQPNVQQPRRFQPRILCTVFPVQMWLSFFVLVAAICPWTSPLFVASHSREIHWRSATEMRCRWNMDNFNFQSFVSEHQTHE